MYIEYIKYSVYKHTHTPWNFSQFTWWKISCKLFEFYKTRAHICTGNTQQQKNTDL